MDDEGPIRHNSSSLFHSMALTSLAPGTAGCERRKPGPRHRESNCNSSHEAASGLDGDLLAQSSVLPVDCHLPHAACERIHAVRRFPDKTVSRSSVQPVDKGNSALWIRRVVQFEADKEWKRPITHCRTNLWINRCT